MRNARDLAHKLSRNLNFAEFALTRELPRDSDVLFNSISDVDQGFFFGHAL